MKNKEYQDNNLENYPEFAPEHQNPICLNCMKEGNLDPETGLCDFCSTHLLIEGRGDLKRGEGNENDA